MVWWTLLSCDGHPAVVRTVPVRWEYRAALVEPEGCVVAVKAGDPPIPMTPDQKPDVAQLRHDQRCIEGGLLAAMDTLGKDGWEVVGAMPDGALLLKHGSP